MTESRLCTASKKSDFDNDLRVARAKIPPEVWILHSEVDGELIDQLGVFPSLEEAVFYGRGIIIDDIIKDENWNTDEWRTREEYIYKMKSDLEDEIKVMLKDTSDAYEICRRGVNFVFTKCSYRPELK